MSGWQLTPYSVPLLASTLLSAAVTAYVWRRRRSQGATALLLVMAAVALWSLAYLLQLSVVDFDAQRHFLHVQYVGVVAVPTTWFAFALSYTGRSAWIRRHWPWLLPVPVLTVLVVWTNGIHGWFWSDVRQSHELGVTLIQQTSGPAFWLHAAYSYALLVVGNVILVSGLLRSASTFRAQITSALLGSLAPWLANALTIFDIVDLPHLDLTPFAFCVSGVLFGWGLLRHQLLDLVPVAQDLVIERMRDGLLLLDDRQRIVDVNPAARALAATEGSLIGRPVLEVVPLLEGLLAQATGAEAQAVVEWTDPDRTDGSPRYFQAQLLSLREHEGRHGYLVQLTDITERLLAEARERELKEQADAANQAKSRFLAHMNHELRNPLMALMGNAEILQLGIHGSLQGKQRDAVDAIVVASESLLAMISESLDMARIESGRVTYLPEDFDLPALIRELVTTVRPLVEGRGNTLTTALSPTVGTVRADRVKVRQCLLNLLTNAAKFTEKGRVELRTEPCRHDDGESVVVHVHDTGIGIPPQRQEAVFEAFTQASDETASRYGVTGLGLSIARSFARGMGGDLVLHSRPGEGSTFSLRLPPARDPA